MSELKLTAKERKKLNDFVNKYLDTNFRLDWNIIKLSKADGLAHNQRVCDLCVWYLHNNVPFLTQGRFKCGYRPDILVPINVPYRIVEVRNTETEKDTASKMVRIPEELKESIIYIDAKKDFNERELL